jgi:hypothetical protein
MLEKDNKMLDIVKWRSKTTNKIRKALFASGIVICLVGAALMFEGAVLGETTTGIATVLGIIGIGLIATQKRAIKRGGE